ncbi:MAG: mechanosensitive ion channel [Magnetococcales bacterium]|nr:mechanosensitive ion channel [Magnetococcales bacterium]
MQKGHWHFLIVGLVIGQIFIQAVGDRITALPTWMHADWFLDTITILWWYTAAWAVVRGADLFFWQRLYGVDTPGVPRPRRELTDIFDIIVFIVATGIIVVDVFHQPISGVFATSGVVAIILGLALQNTLADLFAGLAINIERPFKAGDWITVDGIQGLVLFTNWRSTHLRTRAADDMIVPNSVLAKARVNNHARPTQINVLAMNIPLRYGFDPDAIQTLLESTAATAEGVMTDTYPFVVLYEMLPGHVIWRLHVYIDDFAKLNRVRGAVHMAILRALHTAGLDHLLPNQHLWVHGAEEISSFPMDK